MQPARAPRAMRIAPVLDPLVRTPPPRERHALLINPFYPKDPHASFSKHVLTAAVWRPLVEATRRRHLRFPRALLQTEETDRTTSGSIVSAGV